MGMVGGRAVWAALAQSVEGQFFSTADWQRARLEMWHADKLVRSGQPTANQWAAVQRELDELLISPAVKRRAGSSCGSMLPMRMRMRRCRWSAGIGRS
jgi:hypothetical protein